MTPKEKAEELYNKYAKTIITNESYTWDDFSNATKQCALIAVDEILKAIDYESPRHEFTSVWWQEVKNEIERL